MKDEVTRLWRNPIRTALEQSRNQGRLDALNELDVWHKGECVRTGTRPMPDFPCSVCGKIAEMKKEGNK